MVDSVIREFGVVGFIVLQIIFVSVLGWLISAVRVFRKEMEEQIVCLQKRVNQLEVHDAVKEETMKNFMSLMSGMDKKLDIILDPHFFERCPMSDRQNKK